MKRLRITLILLQIVTVGLMAQYSLTQDGLEVQVDDLGIVRSLVYQGQRGPTDITFRKDEFLKGPSIFYNDKRLPQRVTKADEQMISIQGETDTLDYSLYYSIVDGAFVIKTVVVNKTGNDIKNPCLTLKPGIDTELDSFPQWNNIFFPTLLRCEKTHFWGYVSNGAGEVVALGTKEPVSSWQMEYFDPSHWRGKGGHLIYSFRIDLMHQLPLPSRHPQDLNILKANETKSWTFYLKPVNGLVEVKPCLAKCIESPMIEADRYTVLQGEQVNIQISSCHKISASLVGPDGKLKRVKTQKLENGHYKAVCELAAGVGTYAFRVKSSNGQIAESTLSVRQPYSWYMDKAREASVRYGQYASSHLETWLGLHSGLLAQKYSKEPAIDQAIEDRLNLILDLQWDETTNIPKNMYDMRKVANTAQMISVLVDAYEATAKIKYLEKARAFATFIISRQYENGDYEDYTAIFYPAKSMMELLYAEQDLLDDPTWRLYYDKQYNSVKRAIDYLVKSKDNIMTEGQQTFEDGMISCSATQISMFALMQNDLKLRAHYTKAAELMTQKHLPLEQSLVPDSRMNGGSIRFWEAQYDILETKKWNLINSPHGWSAWRLYGTWYMYQLTGEEKYLLDLQNAIGACVQLIDGKTGTLRWAFAADPYCEVALMKPAASGQAGCADTFETVVGEQYLNMITDFYYPETPETIVFGYNRVRGWSCNNDVHEIFKCMEETCLTSAYVLERADGSWLTMNCDLDDVNGRLMIRPLDSVVKGVHFNVLKEHQMSVQFDSELISSKISGMGWLGEQPYGKGMLKPKLEAKRIVRGEN